MRLSVILFIILLLACQTNSHKPKENKAINIESGIQQAKEKQTIVTLFNEAGSIDSLVILYFSDKVKFRYYTFYPTANAEHLSLLKENLNADTTADNGCIKDGTMYGYIKGSIYTTIYFNLSDSCKYLRLFKDGKLYNYPLSNSFQKQLGALKKLARDP